MLLECSVECECHVQDTARAPCATRTLHGGKKATVDPVARSVQTLVSFTLRDISLHISLYITLILYILSPNLQLSYRVRKIATLYTRKNHEMINLIA